MEQIFYKIGQTVYWLASNKKHKGIVVDDLGKETVSILCVEIDGKRVCKKNNIKRDLLIKKEEKMAGIDVRKTLLLNKFKKHSKEELLTYVQGKGFTDEEKEVIRVILFGRGCKEEDFIDKSNIYEAEPEKKLTEKENEILEKNIHDMVETEKLRESINKTQRKDILSIDPRILTVEEGFNPRNDYGDIEGLKNSIIENGVITALEGYKNGEGYTITEGHRRLRATMMAIKEGVNIARVPFISKRKKTLEERLIDSLISNDGKPLTPLESGETYIKLMQYGYTHLEISKKTGKNAKYISDMILVAESSKEIKGLINKKTVSADLVKEVKRRLKNDEKAEKLIKKKVKEKIEKAEKEGSEKPIRVTKQDLGKNETKKIYPKQELPAILDVDDEDDVKKEPQDKKFFSKEEVLILLKKQVKLCQTKLPKQFHQNLNDIELVLI